MGWVGRLRPTGRDRRDPTSTCARLWRCSGVSWPKAKSRDHLQHELTHRVEETERSFWRDSGGHADDRAGVQIESSDT
jgi:hypothetical protein